MSWGEDMDLDDRLRRRVRCNFPHVAAAEATYLFRWANGAYHLSGFGPERAGAPSGYQEVRRRVARALEDASEPKGDLQLLPHFRHDYLGMVGQFLTGANLRAGQDDANAD